jgi:AICAR transformylase/IMP cyclohydrolase PurH
MEKTNKEDRMQYRTKVKEEFPEFIQFGDRQFKKKQSMRYGENPGYPAAFYTEEGASGPNMATMEILQEGIKGLGYINVGDMDLGQRLVRKLTEIYKDRMICALIKHEMPSGVAMGKTPEETFEKAWKCDSLSNFGSVDVFNYEVTETLAELLVQKERNIEVVYAPGFSSEALEVLASRKSLRVVKMGTSLDEEAVDNSLEFKRVAGGILVQKRFDSRIVSMSSQKNSPLKKKLTRPFSTGTLPVLPAPTQLSSGKTIKSTESARVSGAGWMLPKMRFDFQSAAMGQKDVSWPLMRSCPFRTLWSLQRRMG